jgi:hypothetical protein
MPVLDGAGFLREWGAVSAGDGVPVFLMSAEDMPVHPETLGARGMLLRQLASVL